MCNKQTGTVPCAARESGKPYDMGSLWLYLGLIAAIWLTAFLALRALLPYSAAYEENGILTVGYIGYAAIGILFTTPQPFWAILLVALCRQKQGARAFFRNMIRTPYPKRAVIVTAAYCLTALGYALLRGKPNGTDWIMLPLGFLMMIPFVGFAEETGWRGFLQPFLEKRMKYPFSVLVTAAIWFVWHIDQWFDTTSHHYGDSLIGFCVCIFVWAFALAAIYKATKSILACSIYHAFMDAIGAVYDWNALFDPFPGDGYANGYRLLVLALSIGLWLWADRKERTAGKTGEVPSNGKTVYPAE